MTDSSSPGWVLAESSSLEPLELLRRALDSMASRTALGLGPLLLVSLWGLSFPALLLRRLGEHIQRLQENSSLNPGLGGSLGTAAMAKVGWLEQPLDPFNASDTRSFLQRYWVNDQHRNGQDGPVFLHLGGEGSLGPGSVMTGHPAALAPALGALVISLEHRFYGLSIPTGGLSMSQLRYLSSRHALADVVSAHQAFSRLFNISSSSPWICFGGSYAGSLAAWTRLKFPHLIFAAVASSAPVRAVLDFSEYNNVVSRSLKNTAIGGSLECAAAVAAAFTEVERRLRAGGAAQRALGAELGVCGPLGSREDQAELLGALQALVGGTVQYDGQAGAPLSVRQLCALLRDHSHPTPYRGLRGAVQIVLHGLGQKCLSFPRSETVAQLRATEPQVSGVGERQWLYQTCTEFGFYVTCEHPGCPFSQLPALPSELELCEQVFGLSASSVAQAVAQTNSYYGGQTPGATQVLFVNGETDPWHVLSVTRVLGPSELALLIPNASHCLDMAPERSSDSPSLRLGRQRIIHQLQAWLSQAKERQTAGKSWPSDYPLRAEGSPGPTLHSRWFPVLGLRQDSHSGVSQVNGEEGGKSPLREGPELHGARGFFALPLQVQFQGLVTPTRTIGLFNNSTLPKLDLSTALKVPCTIQYVAVTGSCEELETTRKWVDIVYYVCNIVTFSYGISSKYEYLKADVNWTQWLMPVILQRAEEDKGQGCTDHCTDLQFQSLQAWGSPTAWSVQSSHIFCANGFIDKQVYTVLEGLVTPTKTIGLFNNSTLLKLDLSTALKVQCTIQYLAVTGYCEKLEMTRKWMIPSIMLTMTECQHLKVSLQI
ncbi:thymus-specific serine protease [Thomomys bottae]